MKNKGCICLVVLVILSGMTLFAESIPSLPVHERTAQRYADLAIQYYGSEQYEAAVSYAEMALSYSSSCSDALYVRGLCAREMNETRSEVLSWFEKALECNTFVNWSRETVRITTVGLYVDQYRFDDAITLLDAEPRLLTADAQYYRAESLYGSGKTADARALIASTWRIYPRDWRFPRLFFLSDTPSDPEAKALASRLIQTITNWNDAHPEINLYASAFADEAKAVALLKQYTAWTPMNNRKLSYAAIGLKAGYLTPDEAIERFSLLSGQSFGYQDLADFAAVLSADSSAQATEASSRFKQWLSQYTGTMTFDGPDGSFLSVQYKNGRPVLAECDENRDDVTDWLCAFDYGVARQFSDKKAGISVVYARYPYVTAMYTDTESWELLPDLVSWPSVDVEPFGLLTAASGGKDLYVPVVLYDGTMPGEELFRPAAWRVTYTPDDGEGNRMEFSLQDGAVLSSVTLTSGTERIVTTFHDGIPYTRESDLESDGFVDITEYFEVLADDCSEEDLRYTGSLYGPFTPSAVVRLSRLQIQSESLGINNFVYDIAPDGTETRFWDYDEGMNFSQKVITSADRSEMTFSIADPLEEELVLITTRSDGSVSVTFNGVPLPVGYDSELDFYWIGEEQDAVFRLQPIAQMLKDEVIEKAGSKPAAQTSISVGGAVYVVSKNGNWIFGTRRLYEDIPLN